PVSVVNEICPFASVWPFMFPFTETLTPLKGWPVLPSVIVTSVCCCLSVKVNLSFTDLECVAYAVLFPPIRNDRKIIHNKFRSLLRLFLYHINLSLNNHANT